MEARGGYNHLLLGFQATIVQGASLRLHHPPSLLQPSATHRPLSPGTQRPQTRPSFLNVSGAGLRLPGLLHVDVLLHVEGVHQSHQRSRYKQAKPNTPSKSRRRRRRKLRTKKKTPKTKRERPGLEVCSKLLVGRCRSALLLPTRGRAEAFFHFVRMSKNNHQHHQEPLGSMELGRNIEMVLAAEHGHHGHST